VGDRHLWMQSPSQDGLRGVLRGAARGFPVTIRGTLRATLMHPASGAARPKLIEMRSRLRFVTYSQATAFHGGSGGRWRCRLLPRCRLTPPPPPPLRLPPPPPLLRLPRRGHHFVFPRPIGRHRCITRSQPSRRRRFRRRRRLRLPPQQPVVSATAAAAVSAAAAAVAWSTRAVAARLSGGSGRAVEGS